MASRIFRDQRGHFLPVPGIGFAEDVAVFEHGQFQPPQGVDAEQDFALAVAPTGGAVARVAQFVEPGLKGCDPGGVGRDMRRRVGQRERPVAQAVVVVWIQANPRRLREMAFFASATSPAISNKCTPRMTADCSM